MGTNTMMHPSSSVKGVTVFVFDILIVSLLSFLLREM